MGFFLNKNKSKMKATNIDLLSDIQNALTDSPTSSEIPILKEAEKALQQNHYLPKIVGTLESQLTPLAIKSTLSPKVKEIYLKIVSEKYQTSTTGMGIGMIYGGH